MIDAYQSDWDSTFSWQVFEILSLDNLSAFSPSHMDTCTMMHELMLISILTQYIVNYYIFIIYYLQNLADRMIG